MIPVKLSMARSRILFLVIVCTAGLTRAAAGDEFLHGYECDAIPLLAGWIVADSCIGHCRESVVDGHFRLDWDWRFGELVNYHYWIARPPEQPPPTLWVEWVFRSNRPGPPQFSSCDARLAVNYGGIFDVVYLYGDAATDQSGSYVARNLALDEFHTFRFESADQVHYTVSVDGAVFIEEFEDRHFGFDYLQFGGFGGCGGDKQLPRSHNEWDHVRYGTIMYGEKIAASDPPAGFLDPQSAGGLHCFTVTFDAPNYVYVDDITVEVSGGVAAPVVRQTRRVDNGPPETVEIVLDRPLPAGQRTTFTFDDGAAVQTVSYTYSHGDHDADGDWDLADFASMQNCFGAFVTNGSPCAAFDFDANDDVDLADLPALVGRLSGP